MASRSSVLVRLEEASEVLYREFAAPVPPIIEGCPCCIDTRGVDVLLTTPLRQLSGLDLWRYVTGAFLTVGGERDFRYLLPRIFEIAALNNNGDSPDTEIILGKLARSSWKSWSASERQSIDEFVDAWFEYALADSLSGEDEGWASGFEVESVLCGAAIAGMPISRWLERLKLSFAQPVSDDIREHYTGKITGFWEEAPEAFHEMSVALDMVMRE